jgi:hypothetical protein
MLVYPFTEVIKSIVNSPETTGFVINLLAFHPEFSMSDWFFPISRILPETRQG